VSRGTLRITRELEGRAIDFLARAPYDNVFLTWLIVTERAPMTRSALYACLDDSGEIDGVGFFGRQIVLAAQTDAAVASLAEIGANYRLERMIVGPKAIVELYWQLVRLSHKPPRLVRESQPVMAIERGAVRSHEPDIEVRRALTGEWLIVAQNSARMIEAELDYNPRTSGTEFDANVRTMIERGLWWVGLCDDEPAFFCSEGPRSAQTLQLQGIWTRPEMRGRGIATRALGSICSRLLRDVPTLSLYVNGFNVPAIALYERVGFAGVGEFKTLLF
jgi:RimJ/RimL family protein N-acetyltransferase